MNKKFIYVLVIMLLSGCATLPEVQEYPKIKEAIKPIPMAKSSEKKRNIEVTDAQEEEVKQVRQKGIVIAKTEFLGVLKSPYVLLDVINLHDQADAFQLHIAGSVEEKPFAWDVKTVEPGYFFIELPEGTYKISAVSIPVGSTLATEEIYIMFNVYPNTINYLGTLRIDGTKERVKFGGVPVIRPGFEYTYKILDQRQEGIATLKEKYPEATSEIKIDLMK